MLCFNDVGPWRSGGSRHLRAAAVSPPGPGVAKPQRGEQVKLSGVGSAIVSRDADEDIFSRGLRIFDEDIEIAVFIEHARVEQFVFGIVAAPAAVFFNQSRVGKFRLRILVEVFHVRVGGGRVQIKVALFHVFPVVPLIARKPEEAFLQNGVPAVPQSESETIKLVTVRDPADAILTPAVGPGPCVVVREVFPRSAIGAVVLADGPPLALAQVGPPTLPVDFAQAGFF